MGKVGVGGENPVRIQSMTTSDTRDVEGTITQIMRLADSGCEIARVTVQGVKEAEACEEIKNGLLKRGYAIPLVADIHFYPKAAMEVVEFVDKVRINPGNFVDKRATFKVISYDDLSYAAELKRIEEKFGPFVDRCRKLKKAIRIGVNHGSLSDRIMNRYGDTPEGMVESAWEYAEICRKRDFHEMIFSMKASSPKVMIQAYRLFVERMIAAGWDYPLHLGVTEAGEGEDGRVKSAIGIGALLLEGIGDTIRVSLTEDPWKEIDPCQRLVNFAKFYQTQMSGRFVFPRIEKKQRYQTQKPLHRDGSVILSVSPDEAAEVEAVEGMIVAGEGRPAKVPVIKEPYVLSDDEKEWGALLKSQSEMVFFSPQGDRVRKSRRFFAWLKEQGIFLPVILQFSYKCSVEDLVIQASAEYGALLCDGLGEGICLVGDYPWTLKKMLSFAILQGARMRLSKTEFISCPGCGRTLFDLQSVSAKIRKRMNHLPGVKIAIMGCIVNGPGEMADADFGYVGSMAGKVDLYVGKECVERGVDSAEAEERLVELIKAHGRWVDE